MDPETRVGTADVLAFLSELTMLGLLVAAGAHLAPGWGGWLLGAALAAAAALIWSRWMAPTSGRRLTDPARLVAQVVLFLAVGALVATAGMLWWAVGFVLVAVTAFALTRRPGT